MSNTNVVQKGEGVKPLAPLDELITPLQWLTTPHHSPIDARHLRAILHGYERIRTPRHVEPKHAQDLRFAVLIGGVILVNIHDTRLDAKHGLLLIGE